jgi:signal transduction histidine kinase
VRLNRLAGAAGGVFALLGSAAAISTAGFESWFTAYGGFMALLAVALAVFAWILIGQQPDNSVIWAMSAASFGAGWWLLGLGVATFIVRGDPEQLAAVVGDALIPARVEPLAVRTMMAGESIGLAALYTFLTFGLLLFPDGRLHSRRWRWAGYYSGLAIASTFVSSVWAFRLSSTRAVTVDPAYAIATFAAATAFVVCLLALLIRFRNSTGEAREQFKWVVWGAVAFVPTVVISIILGNNIALGIMFVGELAFLGAFAVAVSRYRLFDVDVVISRTVVVAGLAGFITLVYSVLVGAVGLVIGLGTDAALPLSIAATVVVAVAFQPLRQRMRLWANRLVYGERASPYEVLSRFSSQVRDSVAADAAIPYLAKLLALGTGAEKTTVWMRTDDELQPAGAWPDSGVESESIVIDGALTISGVDHVAQVEQDGELLGAVSVTMPPNESLTATERRLIDDVASQAGMVLQNARLIRDLQTSRQRLVAAQDEERRRLERDLHDGAQQQFIAVKMKVGIAQQLVDQGDNRRGSELLGQVIDEVDAGVQSLRDLAHGIYPPLLEAEGLPVALRDRARRAPIAVSVSTQALSRYSPDIEAAVYFCVLEALQNAIKHAEADHVDVTLSQEGSQLLLKVTDDGRGFDTRTLRSSRGLNNMSDRIEALGGSLTVQSSAGDGTSIIGLVGV